MRVREEEVGMRLMRLTSSRQGFTMIELLIVVIILGTLAVIVVPQFTTTTDDAKAAALDTTLSNMRSVLELYYQQHGEYPSALGDGSNAANSSAAFIAQLTRFTDAQGQVNATKTAVYKYGPYLRKDAIPTEPMTDSSALEIVTAGALGMTATGGDPGGWKFDNVTGQFIVNHSSWDDR